VTALAPRPQPLGALPWPAGMLLLPDVAGAGALAADLVAGREPSAWPAGTEHVQLALAGDVDAALSALPGDDVVSRFNRAVLVGGDGVWESLVTDTDGELNALVRTAAYSVGVTDDPPSYAGSTGEVAAMVGSARAAAAIEEGDAVGAADELALAVQAAMEVGSPLFAASLVLTRTEILREHLDEPAVSAREADAMIRALPLSCPRELRAELQVARALARQALAGTDKGALLAVVADLTEAVKILREDTHPEMFATINEQLALAYLMMPMNDEADRIRLGVAVTSLRAALRVFTPETHPVAWASAQLNLANALQYLPSVHQEQNLDEAVHLYEELLAYRDENVDPVGVARVLLNQGNALGHLGAFVDADEKLTRARTLFERAGEAEGVAAADGLLAEVESARAGA
jgi:tetratricopeptide (TPR) repeat protein